MSYQINTPLQITGVSGSDPQLHLKLDSGNTISLKAPPSLPSSITITLPDVIGLVGQALTLSSTSGGTEWKNPSIETKGTPIYLNFSTGPGSGVMNSLSTAYAVASSFNFNGTGSGVSDSIASAVAICSVTVNTRGGQIRLVDMNTGLIIAESFIFRNTLKGLIDFTNLGQNISSRISVPLGSTFIICTNKNLNNVSDASATGFTAPFSISQLDGTVDLPEEVTINTSGSTPGTVDGTWFALYYDTGVTDYYFFWYDVDDSGTSQPTNPLTPGGTIYEINTVLTGDTADIIAKKTVSAINTATTFGNNIQNLPVTRTIVEIQARVTNGSQINIDTFQIY